MNELENKLSYESDRIRFGEQDKTWNMRDKASGQHFEHKEKRVHSDSSEEKLRVLDKAIQKSDEKLENLYRRKGIVKGKRLHYGTVYKKELSQRRKLENRAYLRRRLLFRKAAKAFEDDSLKADETDAFPDAVRIARNSGRLLYMGSRRMTHKLLEKNSVYRRFDAEAGRNARLKAERRRLSDPGAIREKNAAEAFKKRRKKQQVTEHHRQSQGSFSKRASESRRKVKKVKERAGRTKRVLASMSLGVGIALLLAGAAVILLFAILAMVSAGTSIGASFVSMNDYATMTEGTEFFNDKCTNLYMYLNIDRDRNIEPDLKVMLGSDIDEFVYDVDVPITYNQVDLIAYLSAKYGSFTLSMVETELEDIFAQMFMVEAEIKVEQREVSDPDSDTDPEEMIMEDKKICYVTLKTTSFDDVIADRLTDGQKNSYLGYRLSNCGQQVMNPVMEEDWTNLISSSFGSRYHPIHHEYRRHEGVDIAVPTGTKIYAAVSGEVTAARYSDSAGYMVSITDDNGFTVTYMHLSSYSVAVGQRIDAGQMVALSGNTGNSTGPHLHLAVQDAEGNYLNPVFMIPQTCAKQN